MVNLPLFAKPGISHYSDYTIALKLQAGQGYWVGRVAGWAELLAGQSCGLGRVAGWAGLLAGQDCGLGRIAGWAGLLAGQGWQSRS